MGGNIGYDRNVYDSSSSWHINHTSSSNATTPLNMGGYSGATPTATPATSSNFVGARTLAKEMLPQKKIVSTTKNPIIVALDVTGSNIEFSKVIWAKMPMFYGQIVLQDYLSDFDFSVCAFGDAYCDDYPMQIADFAKGNEIDEWLKKIVLEGGGGGGITESYELMAYYFYKMTTFNPDAEPILFFIGDETPYPKVSRSLLNELGIPYSDADKELLENPFEFLKTKFKNRVYMILKEYKFSRYRDEIEKAWRKVLPASNILKIGQDEDSMKSIVDVMLGVISAVSANQELESYILDMKLRGQTDTRVDNVRNTLKGLYENLPVVRTRENPTKVTSEAGKRI